MKDEKDNICENVLELKNINQVLTYNFFIPGYQRGYKWTKQQVIDLLNDIDSFSIKEFSITDSKTGEVEKVSTWYCLQPLVVKQLSDDDIAKYELSDINPGTWYEVIDGQQRLTTIYLIIKFLNIYTLATKNSLFGKTVELINLPNLFYETRKSKKNNASEFLKCFSLQDGIITNSYNSNMDECIDFHYMKEAFSEIIEWFKQPSEDFSIDNFKNKLLFNTKFIWYESKNENPIKVFQRLNVGKIPLTSAELIKALFLNQSNYSNSGANSKHIYLQQVQIASEWDKIEYKLQDNNFWLFLNNLEYKKTTRIDFIFDLIKTQDLLDVKKNFYKSLETKISDENNKNELLKQKYNELIGDDEYSTFRYFYDFFRTIKQSEKKALECWKKIKNIFMVFEEWYDDIELYHYIGYLLYFKDNISTIYELYSKWNEFSFKQGGLILFKDDLKDEIKSLLRRDKCNNLEQVYELEGLPKKTKVKSLLLLHNIQSIINQNKNFKEKKEYQNEVIYKFPFSLLKKEKWHIEHISPAHPNNLEDVDAQREYLKSVYNSNISKEAKNSIKNYLSKDYEVPEERNKIFLEIISTLQKERLSDSEILNNEEDRNKVWNYVLLDEHTNTSYGNSIYSTKRRVLIGKDSGKKFVYDVDTFELKEIEIDEKDKDKFTSFVPICTKNVFMKYYSPIPNDLTEWTKEDAVYYKKDIEKTLEGFI